MSDQAVVWCVWTEQGEYEQWSRDLRGTFPTEALAEAHAQQLQASREYDECEVTAEPVLTELPVDVPHIRWSAHITPDGQEVREYGTYDYKRGERFRTWSNEITPVHGEIREWWPGSKRDLYIEVIGSDAEAVQAEYKRLLAEARRSLEHDRRCIT